MNWSSMTTVAGIGVALVGLAAVLATTSADVTPTPETLPSLSVSVTSGTADSGAGDASLPEIPGVAGEVTRVLYWKGAAERINPLELSGVPTAVGSILMEYGIPLRVPTESPGANE